MVSSDIGFIEHQAYGYLDNFGNTLDYLQKKYEETGNEEYLKCRSRMLVRYQETSFSGSPASENNDKTDFGKNRYAGAPCSENNSDKPSRNKVLPEVKDDSFADRVKTIIRKAAEKNGQRIETSTRGHAGAYTFYINADAFCKAIDKLSKDYKKDLKDYLDGSLKNVQVTKVCRFIGYVIRLHIINDSQLRLTDLAFAFADYYTNLDTVKKKLSAKKFTHQEEDFFLIFKNRLKTVKALNNPE